MPLIQRQVTNEYCCIFIFCEKENQFRPFGLQNENHNRNFARRLEYAKTHAGDLFHFVDTYDHHTIPIHVSDTSMIIRNRQLHKLLSHLADSEAQ